MLPRRPHGAEAHHGKPYSSGVATTPSFELVGRGRERARLVDFAARLREGPGALLIRGEPGIGKTMLWRESVAAAQDEGIRVLVARCAEAEMPVPLGAVSDLLDPGLCRGRRCSSAEPQRRALSAALGIEIGAGGRPDRLTLLRALVCRLPSPRERWAVAPGDR